VGGKKAEEEELRKKGKTRTRERRVLKKKGQKKKAETKRSLISEGASRSKASYRMEDKTIVNYEEGKGIREGKGGRVRDHPRRRNISLA